MASKQAHSHSSGRDDVGLVLLVLVLLAFLAVALILFGSGWMRVDLGAMLASF